MGKAARLRANREKPAVSDAVSPASIQKKLDNLREQHAQCIANANALSGAIALCEQLLKEYATPPAPAVPGGN